MFFLLPKIDLLLIHLYDFSLFLSPENQADDENDEMARNSIDDSTWFEQTAEWNDSSFDCTQEESTMNGTVAEDAPNQNEESQQEVNGHEQSNGFQNDLSQANGNEMRGR